MKIFLCIFDVMFGLHSKFICQTVCFKSYLKSSPYCFLVFLEIIFPKILCIIVNNSSESSKAHGGYIIKFKKILNVSFHFVVFNCVFKEKGEDYDKI